jgi:hypothetical protein
VNFDWLDFAGYCLPETVASAMALEQAGRLECLRHLIGIAGGEHNVMKRSS